VNRMLNRRFLVKCWMPLVLAVWHEFRFLDFRIAKFTCNNVDRYNI
jgi:hypothetical protein